MTLAKVSSSIVSRTPLARQLCVTHTLGNNIKNKNWNKFKGVIQQMRTESVRRDKDIMVKQAADALGSELGGLERDRRTLLSQAGVESDEDFALARKALAERLTEAQGALENTIFVFTSDNGAEGSGAQDPFSFAAQRAAAGQGYNMDYDILDLDCLKGIGEFFPSL